ncbi:MAG: hypothetical protein KDH15_21605 [Rhodocyclaceae bacterium]|nr:hypothetical protein [Rhodocyclaceae bacterium]
MEVWLVLWIGFAILTAMAASSRGRSGFGWFVLGLLFGIFALLAVLVLPRRNGDSDAPTPDTHVRCPDCQELVLKEARVCKHCHCRLVPQ